MRASAWTIAGHGISQTLRFGSNLVMTRLMAPEMFGVISIATMMMVGIGLFSDIGLRQSIIQSQRGEDPAFLNTAWSAQIIRGILVFGLALLLSGFLYLAQQYGQVSLKSVYVEPTLPSVLAILAFTAAIGGFESTKSFVASRNLDLGRVAIMEIGGQIVGIIIMISWALLSRTIWALVAGGIAAGLTRVFLSHTIFTGIPNRWQWEATAVKEIIGMGKWIFLSTILTFILSSGDRIILGSIVSVEILGVYSIAFLILNSLDQGIGKLISTVCYSAISEVVRESNNYHVRLREIYYKFLIPTDIVLLSLSGFFFVSGDAIIALLYDSRYREAGWMLQVLSFSLIGIRFNIASCCFLAIGKPRFLMWVNGARLAGLYIMVPLGFHFFKLHGALWALSLAFLSGCPVVYYYNYKFGILDWRRELITFPNLAIGAGLGKIFAWMVGIGFLHR